MADTRMANRIRNRGLVLCGLAAFQVVLGVVIAVDVGSPWFSAVVAAVAVLYLAVARSPWGAHAQLKKDELILWAVSTPERMKETYRMVGLL